MLRVDGLSKSFGALAAVRGVTMAVAPGERRALIGPNGAGKTTLFDLIAGAHVPDAGRIAFRGRDVTRAGVDARARAGLARSYQRNNLFPGLSVRENLEIAAILAAGDGAAFWRAARRLRRAAGRVEEVAAAVGVAGCLDEPAGALSYGLQRQLEVGLALTRRPALLMLDEPTAGMSPAETAAMTGLIAGLPRETAILVIEHDMDVAFALADRVTVLDYGTVLFEGAPAEVRASGVVQSRYLGAAP